MEQVIRKEAVSSQPERNCEFLVSRKCVSFQPSASGCEQETVNRKSRQSGKTVPVFQARSQNLKSRIPVHHSAFITIHHSLR
jgi:hypothetical protein